MESLPEGLAFETENGVGVLTLNRPDKRNALTTPIMKGLRDVFQEVKGRDEIKVLIITGSDPAFCAGAL